LNAACSNKIKLFFEKFVHGSVNIVTSPEAAEMVKLAENSYRDVNIAFANELSIIAAEVGVNVWEIIDNANVHPRVNILEPGTGVGGHCIAVDPWFLHFSAPYIAQLIKTAREVNTAKTYWVLKEINEKIEQIKIQKGLKQVSVAVYGLTFKPDVDDLRESPALWVAQKLSRQEDVVLTAIDPLLNCSQQSLTKLNFSDLKARGSFDLEVLLVAHMPFKNILFSDSFLSFTRYTS
jgi:UDP-N-acetyl-D-mannosaminuronic acid dehydrogenase